MRGWREDAWDNAGKEFPHLKDQNDAGERLLHSPEGKISQDNLEITIQCLSRPHDWYAKAMTGNCNCW